MKKEVKKRKSNPILILILGIILLALLFVITNQLNNLVTGKVITTTQTNGYNIVVYTKVVPLSDGGGNGGWYILNKDGSQQRFNFGWQDTSAAGIRYQPKNSLSYKDYSLIGDFDGDGKSDLAVGTYKLEQPNFAGSLFLKYSSNGGNVTITGGWPGLIPVFADYDGDNKTDAALYAPVVYKADNVTEDRQAVWFIRNSSNGLWWNVSFGWDAVIPVPADYDGDGREDIAVYYPNGTWYISQSKNGFRTISFGWNGANPVPADYDGDKKTDIAVYYPNGTWYITKSSNNLENIIISFGYRGPVVVTGDYDGDKKDDLTLYDANTGMWYSRSLDGVYHESTSFGYSGTVPAVGYFEGVDWGGFINPPTVSSSCDVDSCVLYDGGQVDVLNNYVKISTISADSVKLNIEGIITDFLSIGESYVIGSLEVRITDIAYPGEGSIASVEFEYKTYAASLNCTDNDRDGYNVSKIGCGFSDCNDNNASINPGVLLDACDGVDNNCNGAVDEGCSGCTSGENRSCTGISIGECKVGVQICNASGFWGSTCVNAVLPVTETCDGKDNDCNSIVDDSIVYSPATCGTLNPAKNGVGRCKLGIKTCVNGNTSCVGEVQPAIKEICNNGIDDDCNNEVDETSCTLCNGCFIDNKCYSYGFRMNVSGIGKYCNFQGTFANQRDTDSICQDSYECKSNFCSEGKCVNLVTEIKCQTSLLWKIWCWISNLGNSDACIAQHAPSSC
jgi:(2Fe-2S) ferredoxin